MDGPQQDLSLFVQFPTDIWAYLVCYLSGEQLGCFKMTGAKHLWFKLSYPRVVTSVSLGTEPVLIFKSWPAFLNELPSLESLSIKSPSHEWWSLFDLKLDQLPSTLRELKLRHFISFNLFFGQAGHPLHPDQFTPHLQVLNLVDIFTYLKDDFWMMKFPPSLTKLKIPNLDGPRALPSSLRYFAVYELRFKGLSGLLDFPSGLEVLSIGKGNEGNAISLPISIEHLPPTLTKLYLSSCVPTSLWSILPYGLKKLRFRTHEPSVLSTKICPRTGKSFEIRSYPFETLPRSITSLTILTEELFCGPPSPAQLASSSYYPPHLVKLALSRIHLSPEAAKYLPPSLTHLELCNLSARLCEHLPKGLLHLGGGTLMSPNLIKLLPKKLTSLELGRVTDKWYSYDTGQRIEPISEAEDYDSHENYGTNIDWKGEYSLPPNLINLGFYDMAQIEDSFFLNQNLRNLCSLYLDSQEITDLSIPFLGPNMTHLDLEFAHHVTGKCFAQLPRSLLFLRLPSSSTHDVDIQHLPRTIKTLCLDSAVHLTDSCVATLPPDLEALDMRSNELITPSSLPQFPAAIRSSQSRYTATFAKWMISLGQVE